MKLTGLNCSFHHCGMLFIRKTMMDIVCFRQILSFDAVLQLIIIISLHFHSKSIRIVHFVLVYLPESNAAAHIMATEHHARLFVDTYRNGKHIAYHRSIEMNVNVSTDTVMDTPWIWPEKGEKERNKKLLETLRWHWMKKNRNRRKFSLKPSAILYSKYLRQGEERKCGIIC